MSQLLTTMLCFLAKHIIHLIHLIWNCIVISTASFRIANQNWFKHWPYVWFQIKKFCRVMMLSKVQVVHLFILPYSVQCSLSHCRMTETIADLTLAKDHTQQRSQCFCPWIYLVGGVGNLSQKILWHFPQFEGPELDHQNLIWLKEGWETKALMLGASRVRDRLWWTMNVYVKERGSVCAWQCWGGRPQTVGWLWVSNLQCPP